MEKTLDIVIAELEELKLQYGILESKFEKSTLFRQKLEFELTERRKELNCQNQITQIFSIGKPEIAEVCEKIVGIIPDAFQVPEFAGAQIKIYDKVFRTPGFAITNHLLASEILTDNIIIGKVEVSYPNDFVAPSGMIFLPEETDLLVSIAGRLGIFIQNKEWESALQKSEEKYRGIFENIPDVYFETDLNGIILEISPSVLNISMSNFSREKVIGTPLMNYYLNPGDGAAFIQEILNKGKVVDYELQIKNTDGSVVPVLVSSTLWYDLVGNPEKIVGILRNISVQKSIEKNLKDSEARYRSLVENSGTSILVMDKEGKYLDLNSRAAAFLGGVPDDFIGKSIAIGLNPEVAKAFIQRNKELIESGTGQVYEQSYELASGIKTFLVTDVVLKDSDGVGIALQSSGIDITDSIYARNQLGLILDNTDEMIFAIDKNYKLIISNASFKKATKSAGGKQIEICEYVMSEDYPEDFNKQWKGFYDRALNGESFNVETSPQWSDGLHYMNNSLTPLRHENGNIIGVVVVTQDITTQKNGQIALIQSEEKYRTIFENIQDVYYEASLDGTLLEVSPSIGIISKGQYTRDELIGKSFVGMYADPDIRNSFFSELFKRGSVSDFELILRNKDGSMVTVSVSSSLKLNAEDNPEKIIGTIRDVTGRKKNEEALRASRQQLIALNEQLAMAQQIGHTGSWFFDLATQELHGSAEAKRLFGFDENTTHFTIENIEACIPDRERVHQALFDLINNSLPYDLEYVIHPADGSMPRVIVSKARLERNDAGQVTSITGVIQDITARKRAEEALRESETLYKAILNTSPDDITITDLNGNILFASHKALTMFRYESLEQLINRNMEEFIITEDRPRAKSEIIKMLQGIVVNPANYKAVRSDESLFDIEVNGEIMRDDDGNPTKMVFVVRDVTERLLAEENLKKSEEKFRAITEQSVDFIAIADEKGTITFASKSSTTVFLISPEEMCGHNFIEFVDETEAERALNLFRESIEHEIRITTVEFRMKRMDRTVFIGEISGSKFVGQNQTGILVTIRDITQRKQAEETLKQSEENLNYAQEIAKMGSWEHSFTTNKLRGSKQYYRLLGLQPFEKKDNLFEHFLSLVHPDDLKNVEYLRNSGFRNNETKVVDIRLVMPDGTLKWVQNKVVAVYDGDVKTGLKGVNIDITDKKKAEEDLRKFKTISDQANYGSAFTTTDGIIQYINPAFAEMHGYEAQELIGRPLQIFHNEEQLEYVAHLLEILASKSSFLAKEVWHVKKDGTPFPTLMNGSVVYDSEHKPQYFTATAMDITDIFESEKALKQSEENLNYAQEIARMGSWEFNLKNGEYAWSKNNYLMAGMQPFEKEVTIDYFFKLIHPDDISIVYEKVEEAQRDKKEVKCEFRILKPNGEIIWMQNNIVPLIVEDQVVTLRGVNFDVTEKKATEEKIKQQNERLSAIIQANPDMIFVLDGNGTYKEVYSSSLDQLLLPVDKIIGSNIRKFFGDEEAQNHLHHINKCIKEKKLITYEYDLIINNQIEFFEARLVPFANNQVLSLIRNITHKRKIENEIRELNAHLEKKIEERTAELARINADLINEIEARKMIEEALDHEKRRLDDIIRGTNVGTWEWNIQTGETIFNERWANIIGYTLDEISPLSIDTWMKFAHPDDLVKSGELLQKHFDGELDYYEIETRMKHKNGDWVWVFDRGKVHTWDKEGKPLLMSGTHQDITGRKRASEFESELLQLSLQLTGIPIAEIPSALNLALEKIGGFLGADRAYIFELDLDENIMNNTFEWCNEGINPEIKNLQNLPSNHLPRWSEMIIKHQNMIIPSIQDLPDTWQNERKHFEQQGIQSLISIPMFIDSNLIGFVGLDSVKNKRNYTASEVNILKVWSNLLASLIKHQQKEKIIHQTRVNYETFFNTIDDFLFVLDEQGNLIHTNTTVTRRLGYTSEELMGKNVLMVHPTERREEAMQIVGEMLAGTSEFCPVPLVTKSGEYIPVETRVKMGRWDGKPAIFGVTKDISAIKLSEEKFSKAFRSNSALMAISAFKGEFIDVNDSFINTLGYSREEIIGNTSVKLNLFEDTILRDTITENIRQGIPVREVEVRVRTKSGDIRTGLFSADSIYVGKDPCLLTMMVDITERKQTEKALLKAKSEAEKANHAKSEFLSRMSHELRTPMNSILGFAQLLDMGELAPAHRKGVKYILKSGRHLLGLINEVLDISRIEAGKFSISIEPVRIGGIIVEMLDILKQFANQQQVTIELMDSPVNDRLIMADKQRAKQVLINLVNNAIKYNHEGGSVVIKTEIRPVNEKAHGMLRISFSDTGQGISADDLSKIFVPFERIGAEKTNIEGTGLGLSVVSKLMEAMNGNIGVESTLGQGSNFWIEFPLYEGEHTIEDNRIELSDQSLNLMPESKTILYIEDNVSNIELVEQILVNHSRGIKLISNVYGKQSVSMASELLPDLILLDLNLPDIHGTEVFRMLQENEITKDIPVVVISADAMPHQIERMMLAGVKNYLSKPLDVQMFLNVVEKWIMV